MIRHPHPLGGFLRGAARTRSLLVLVVLAAVGGRLWTLRAPAHDGVIERVTRGADTAAEQDVTLATDEALTLTERTSVDSTTVDSSPTEPAPITPKTGEDAPFTLMGRFVLPNGQPAAGAIATLKGWAGNVQRTTEFGRPEHWEDPSVVLGDDGSLRLAFDPPRAYVFALRVKLSGYASVGWRWSSLGPEGSKDLGTTALGIAGDVAVRIVDGVGEPVVSGWLVYSEGPPHATKNRTGHGAMAPIQRATGRALLTDLPVGPNSLSGYHSSNGWLKGPTVDIVAGEAVVATLVWTGPDLSRRIRAGVTNRLFRILADVEPGALVLVAADGTQTPFERGVIDDVAPGVYSIQLDDERYVPVRIEGVTPGERKTVRLVGSATLELNVTTSTGAPVDDYELIVEFSESGVFPNRFPLRAKATGAPEGGRYPGLVPGVTTVLHLDAGALGYGSARLEGLVPHEVRVVQIVLMDPAEMIRVRVERGAAAAPIEGVQVGLFDGELHPDTWQLFMARSLLSGGSASSSLHMLDRTRADEDGVATLSPAASYVGTLSAFATIDGLEVAARIEGRAAVLRFPGYGRVEVEVHGAAAGRAFPPPGTALTVVLQSQVKSQWGVGGQFGAGVVARPREDGVFVAQGVTAGPSVVRLVHASREIPNSRSNTSLLGASGVALAKCLVREGAVSRVSVDVEPHLPGALELDLTCDGSPLVGVIVVLAPSVDPATGGAKAQDERRGAVTDAHGRATFSVLPPGQWMARVQDLDRAWSFTVTDPAEGYLVASGEWTRVELSVPIVVATLTFLADESGEPLVSEIVMFRSDLRFGPLRTDAHGQVELTLTPGRYEFSRQRGKDAPAGTKPEAVAVEWGVGGPVLSTVRLPAR